MWRAYDELDGRRRQLDTNSTRIALRSLFSCDFAGSSQAFPLQPNQCLTGRALGQSSSPLRLGPGRCDSSNQGSVGGVRANMDDLKISIIKNETRSDFITSNDPSEQPTKTRLASRDRAADRRKFRHRRDHAAERQEQVCDLALAGAVHTGGRRWPAERRHPPVACSTACAAGDRARRRAEMRRSAGRGNPLDGGRAKSQPHISCFLDIDRYGCITKAGRPNEQDGTVDGSRLGRSIVIEVRRSEIKICR